MLTRLLLALMLAVLGAVVAAALFSWAEAPWGALVALLGASAVDGGRAQRLLESLRKDAALATLARPAGLWGQVSDRIGRLMRQHEERLRQSERRLQEFLAAIESSPNGVTLLDEQGRIEWCNQTAADHFGFDARRDLQQYASHLIRDPSFSGYLASWNYSRDVILTRMRPGEAQRKLSVQAHAYAGNRRLVLSRDVTTVEQAEAMRRDFVANVSHEIRTPLTVLSGFVETLQTLQVTDDERARYLALMAQQAHRMQSLVSDLLTLSRLEGSPLPGTLEWMPAARMLEPCEQEARSLSQMLCADGSAHQLQFDVQPDTEISGASAELLSAMSNLVNNAVRYTPPGGRIEVRWQVLPDGRGEFTVRDSGPGIAPEHLPRLTERFYRVDRSRSRETGGTGLGLAIVKHVVQRHGGEMRIDSELGVGSTFGFSLPPARIRQASAVASVATP
jgi:two-component system, OmpR family, phosphate regulon sensor histidine kinase PhoR